ncbi:MAG: SDR family NAD(P)-dependent oxidoreductase [Candidatus Omnitrophica bacterium]|nr:SDR family NAD(P)-dependent oxidoreductase [Candidatus Omnitrophota bacterium]
MKKNKRGAKDVVTARRAEELLCKTAPVIRGLLAEPSASDGIPYNRVILKFSPFKSAKKPALCLDWLGDAVSPEEIREKTGKAIRNFSKAYGSKPQVVLIPGVGILYVEKTKNTGLPLQNEVAVVTGAGGAIGSGICRGLLEKGCCVAAADLSKKSLDTLVGELGKKAKGRIIGVEMDVTDKDSVARGFNEVIRTWGGADIVIANAGIPLIGKLIDMEVADFRKLEKVNVEGTLLTLSEGSRLLCLQGTGGDIVIVSTKNVFSPGAGFGAYSATKAAAHQLGRIASLELSGFDIRVNMVAPDAVFSDGGRKSGLWEKVGPERMRDRGITDMKELQEYYRNRNLLKARVTARHVANAVLFFVTRQTPTTGATIPVDGGLPDATPR